ncbi:peroxiredoxin-like family protein [Sulfuriroseicoccus oceanibius]|uniref:AhpC/TSA family protein n=1 Tax=Sulfuriroseicoccus oceanibius TaxID=2707525 RepID=A0A6B3L5G9_9BACT|nr:peroxiredoxin-like family protein [Sulfuriroseicoccus oceanibius]QQL45344.1 AhpC/TSA family protein [Sulfuriroseicoccus oceanibius]
MSQKLISGGTLPILTLPLVGGDEVTLGKTSRPGLWQIVIIYRGLHCPLCHKYLKRLEELRTGFANANAELVAISGDPLEKAEKMVSTHGLQFPVAYGLTVPQMQELGLYVSDPRSPEETDRPFPEPATFALNSDGRLHLIELSNTPFNRADLAELLDTVEWVQENDYPIRGTHC